MSAIPIAVPSFNTTLSQPVAKGDTTIYIDSTTDDQGNDLNGRIMGVTINSGQSNEELVVGTVNTSSGALTSCIRDVDFNDGATSNSTGEEHDAKSPVKVTSFPYLTLVSRMLNGTDVLGGTLKYDPGRTISGAQDLVDKEFAESLTVASFPDFATVDAGGLDVDVQSGTLVTATGTIEFAGVSGQTLTDNATNYIELDENGNLAVNTTGWTEGNVPLSKVITASGDISSISLNRGLITVPISDSTVTDDYTFGDTIAVGDFVYLDTSDSKWKLADASAEATAVGLIGVALEAGVDTDTGKRVQIAGVVTGLTGLTAGYQYISDTAGEISNSPGTWRRNVGFAPNATSIVLAPTPSVGQLSGGNSDSTPANLNEALTFFANTDFTASEAETLTVGPTSNADSLHYHNSMNPYEWVGISTITADLGSIQIIADPDFENVYVVLGRGTAPNRTAQIYRYQVDQRTNALYYVGGTTLSEPTYNYVDNSFGAVAGENYLWIIGRSTGPDVEITRLDKDLTNPQVMTISGTALTTAAVISAAGDDNTLYVGLTGSSTVAVYTISGTTATRGSDITVAQGILGYDGTDLLLFTSDGTLEKYSTAGGSSTGSRRFTVANVFSYGGSLDVEDITISGVCIINAQIYGLFTTRFLNGSSNDAWLHKLIPVSQF